MDPASLLAHANALLNAIAAVAVFTAWRYIKAGNEHAHQRYMLIGLGASAVFLVFYLFYHALVGYLPFPGQGWVRPVYFTILITHVFLAAVIALMIPVVVYNAWKGRREQHRRIARWVLPAWLYVSVTGIIVYAMVYHIPWN